jgi:hypothetical protein
MPASRFGTPRKYPCASTLGSNSLRFTHFRKNASATPLVSHSFITKDLKPFRFTHFQKNGRGRVPQVAQACTERSERASACVGTRYCPSSSPGDSACFELSTVDCQLSALSLLTSTLTKTTIRPGMVVPSERSEPRDLSLRVTPLDSALTSKRASNSFTCNTYEKHTQGEGGTPAFDCQLCAAPGLLVTNHEPRVTTHFPALRRPDRSAIIVCSAKGIL